MTLPSGSIGQYALMTIKSFGKRRALTEVSDSDDVTMSFRTMINQVKACAIGLLYCGVSASDVVLVVLPSVPHVPVVALAIALIGGTCCPLSPETLEEEVNEAKEITRRLQHDTGATTLFTTTATMRALPFLASTFRLSVTVALSDEEQADEQETTKTSGTTKSHQTHTYDEILALGRSNSKKVPPPAQVNGATSIGFLLPTQRCTSSSSSALERLVPMTHRAVASVLVSILEAKEFHQEDVVAIAAPFWDARVLFGAVLPALLSGACVVCPCRTADPSTLLMLLTNHSVTQLFVNRSCLRYIAKHHASSCDASLGAMLPGLERICCVEAATTHMLNQCAAACSAEVCVSNCPPEMGGRVCLRQQRSERLGGGGGGGGGVFRTLPLLPGVECKILHPGTRKMCAPGKRGLVCLKGASMMFGKEYASPAVPNCQ